MPVIAAWTINLFWAGWIARSIASRPLDHAAFGLMLWIFVVLRFRARTRCARSRPMREFSRELSRNVYLLLYLAVGANSLRGARPETMHDLLVYGLTALVLIRVLASIGTNPHHSPLR